MPNKKYGYMAKLGVESDGLQNGLNDADRAVRNFGAELRAVENLVKQYGETNETAAQRVSILEGEINATRDKLRILQQAQAEVEHLFANEQLSPEEYRQYQRELVRTEQELARLEQAHTEAQAALENLDGVETATEETATLRETLSGFVDTYGEKAGKLADNLAKSVMSISKTAYSAVSNIVNQSTTLYGEYEQLVGGVQTLFGDASNTVIENAEKAFSTAGISANEYMQTATSFAASLISSLEGNTQEAASVVDTALQDMADNANKMGTQMASIQWAYQGFAKQNYTMLDNLKLGYGGTKTEMQRLLADAEKLTGVHYDLSHLDDVINAIHAIQQNLGITGTTADEAARTIQGSMGSVKAAWENLLTAMASEDFADKADQMVNDFITTFEASMNNMGPAVTRAVEGIGTLVEELAPVIIPEIEKLSDILIPPLTDATMQMLSSVIKTIEEHIPEILETIWNALGDLTDGLDAHTKDIIAAIVTAWGTLKGLGILKSLSGFVKTVQTVVIPTIQGIAAAAGTATIVVSGVIAVLTALIVAEVNWTESQRAAWEAEYENERALQKEAQAARDLKEELEQLTSSTDENGNKRTEIEHAEGVIEAFERSKETIEEYQKKIDENKQKMRELSKARDEAVAAGNQEAIDNIDEQMRVLQVEISAYAETIHYCEDLVHDYENIIDEYSDEVSGKITEASDKVSQAWIDGKNRTEEAMQNSVNGVGKTSRDILQEQLDKYVTELEDQLDLHQITQEEYYQKLNDLLNTYNLTWSKDWWSKRESVDDYLAKQEKARADELEKEKADREKAAEAARKAREDAYKEALDELNWQAEYNDLSKKERLKQRRELLEMLDDTSDLYQSELKKLNREEMELEKQLHDEHVKELSDLWSKASKAVKDYREKAQAEAKANEQAYFDERLETIKTESDRIATEYETVQKKIEETQNDLQASLFSDKMTDVKGDTRYLLTDYDQKLKDLKKYQSDLEKLKATGISDGMLDEIMKIDYNSGDREAFIQEILRMSETDRQKFYAEQAAYQDATHKASEDFHKEELEQVKKEAEEINTVYQEALDAAEQSNYQKGYDAAVKYLDGWKQAMGENNSLVGISAQQVRPDYQQISETAVQVVMKTFDNMNFTLNVAGTEAIKTTFGELIRQATNSGGALNI